MNTPPNNTPDPETVITNLVADGFTREEAEAIAGQFGDVVELGDDELDITIEED